MSADHIVTKWHWLRGWVPAHEPVATLPQFHRSETKTVEPVRGNGTDGNLGYAITRRAIDPGLYGSALEQYRATHSELRASTANDDVNQVYARTRP